MKTFYVGVWRALSSLEGLEEVFQTWLLLFCKKKKKKKEGVAGICAHPPPLVFLRFSFLTTKIPTSPFALLVCSVSLCDCTPGPNGRRMGCCVFERKRCSLFLGVFFPVLSPFELGSGSRRRHRLCTQLLEKRARFHVTSRHVS